MGLIRHTAALWGPALFAAATTFAAEQQPGYSHRSHHISGLAATGEKSAKLMVPGFLALGASQLVMPMRSIPTTALTRLAGIGVTTAGLVRASTRDCPRPSIDPEANDADVVHTVASVATFVTWTALPLLASRGTGPRWFRRISAILGAASVAGLVAAGATTQAGTPERGLAQRAFLGTVFAWQALTIVERLTTGVSSRTSGVARRTRRAISTTG